MLKIFNGTLLLKLVFSSSRALMLAYGDSMSIANNANCGNIGSNCLCDSDGKTKVRLTQPDH